jgi:hypothetical protein
MPSFFTIISLNIIPAPPSALAHHHRDALPHPTLRPSTKQAHQRLTPFPVQVTLTPGTLCGCISATFRYVPGNERGEKEFEELLGM